MLARGLAGEGELGVGILELGVVGEDLVEEEGDGLVGVVDSVGGGWRRVN